VTMRETQGSNPEVSICVATYKAHRPPNLGTLGDQIHDALGRFSGELIVSLNGISRANAQVPEFAHTVDLDINRGVAPGWNAAARAALGGVLVFANDDLELNQRSVETMVSALLDCPAAGVVGPSGSRWDIERGTDYSTVDLRSHRAGTTVECEVVDGYLFACRRSTFELIGGFDEFYAPASWEEVDFCTAARFIGLRNFAVSGVDARHDWGVSRKQPPWRRISFDGRSETLRSIHRRNRQHFLEKWSRAELPSVES